MALTTRQRILYGGLGGLAPLLIMLVNFDSSSLDDVSKIKYDFLHVGVFLVRYLALIFLGSLVAFLNDREEVPWRAFMLGISAPALITTGLSGAKIPPPQKGYIIQGKISMLSPTQTGGLIINSAFAENVQDGPTDTANTVPIYDFCLPRRSVTIRIIGGLVGQSTSTADLGWLVAGPYDDKEQAYGALETYKKINNLVPKIFRLPNDGGQGIQYIVAVVINLIPEDIINLKYKDWEKSEFPINIYSFSYFYNKLSKDEQDKVPICHFNDT